MAEWSPVVPAFEEYSTREENFEGENSFANVTLRCEAANSNALIRDLILYERVYPFNALLPYPFFAKNAYRIYAKQKYTTDAQQQVINYDGHHALVTVHYRRKASCKLAVDPLTGGFVSISEEFEPLDEFIEQENKDYFWADRLSNDAFDKFVGIKQKETSGLPLARGILKRTVSGLPFISPQIFTYIHKINQDQYVSNFLGFTFRETTLRCGTPMFRRLDCLKDENGIERHKWEMLLKFFWKDDGNAPRDVFTGVTTEPAGWNYYWRSQTQQFEKMYKPLSLTAGIPIETFKGIDMANILFNAQ